MQLITGGKAVSLNNAGGGVKKEVEEHSEEGEGGSGGRERNLEVFRILLRCRICQLKQGLGSGRPLHRPRGV